MKTTDRSSTLFLIFKLLNLIRLVFTKILDPKYPKFKKANPTR